MWLPTYGVGVELARLVIALAALIDGPMHGYAIAQRARELSGGRVRLSTGTLYALLERALSESLVIAGEPYVEGGRQRRDYTLTPAGRALLVDESARLADAAKAVSSRLRATSRGFSPDPRADRPGITPAGGAQQAPRPAFRTSRPPAGTRVSPG